MFAQYKLRLLWHKPDTDTVALTFMLPTEGNGNVGLAFLDQTVCRVCPLQNNNDGACPLEPCQHLSSFVRIRGF